MHPTSATDKRHGQTRTTMAARVSRWIPVAPLGFIIVALVALVALPLLGDRYTRQFHHEMRTVAEPGRGLVTDMHLALALQGSALHDYVETGQPVFLERYRQALARERAAYERFEALSERLGSDVSQRFAALRELETRWHSSVEEFLRGSPRTTAKGDPLQEDLYDEILVAAARLDQAIMRAVQLRRSQILTAERVERRLAVFLAILALIAVLTAAWVGHQLRAIAEEAEQRRRELEQIMESKARLMRGFSHDLKNPLGAIDGHAQLLQDRIVGDLSPAQQHSVSRIRASVRGLLALIGDLVELSRVEARQLRLDPRPTDLRGVVREAAAEHRAAAEAAGHRFEVHVADNLPVAQTDADRIRQVLGNLLSNAVKYTPTGGRILMRAETRVANGRPRAGRWLVVDVIDSGPGIPPDQLDHVFEEFSRLAPNEKPGAGLGLAIARRIAQLLGGEITVTSQVGQGSTFTLWLPFTRQGE